MTRIKWKLVSVRLEILLFLTQDRCTICAERTIGSNIVFDAPDVSPRKRRDMNPLGFVPDLSMRGVG